MPAVLNPTLYSALVKCFGDVRVANEGVALDYTLKPYVFSSGKITKRVSVLSGGEYYRVNCPFCGDTRGRLWVNHKWNTEVGGTRLRHLAVCYNEHCEQEPDFTSKLLSKLTLSAIKPGRVAATLAQPKPAETVKGKAGVYIPVNKLPDNHPIVRYLVERRKFNLDYLATQWDVSWCDLSLVLPPHNRLVFPVYEDFNDKNSYIGCQARWYDIAKDTDKPPDKQTPKYYTHLHKQARVYNMDRARKNKELVVLCEGPLDAIRVGTDYGVAALGTPTRSQVTTIESIWGTAGGIIVYALDEDASAYADKLVEGSRARGFKATKLLLPKGIDPSDLQVEDLWALIRMAVKTV